MASNEFISVNLGKVVFHPQAIEVYFSYLTNVIAEINEGLKESNKNYSVIDNLSENNFSSEYYLDFRVLRDKNSPSNAAFDYSFKLSFVNNTLYFVTILGSVKIGEFESLEVVQSDIASKLSKYGFSLSNIQENHHNFDPQFLYKGLPLIEANHEAISDANQSKISGIISSLLKQKEPKFAGKPEDVKFSGKPKDVISFTKAVDLTKWFEIVQDLLLASPKTILEVPSSSQENVHEEIKKVSDVIGQAKTETPVVKSEATHNNGKFSCYSDPNDTDPYKCYWDTPSKSELKKATTFFTWSNVLIGTGILGVSVFGALKVYNKFAFRNIYNNHNRNQDEFIPKLLTTTLAKILNIMQENYQGKSSQPSQGSPLYRYASHDDDVGGGGYVGAFSPQSVVRGGAERGNLVINLLNDLKSHYKYKNQGKTAQDLLNAFEDYSWVGENGEKLMYPDVMEKIFSGTFGGKVDGGAFKTILDYRDMLQIDGFIEQFRETFDELREGNVRWKFFGRLVVDNRDFLGNPKYYNPNTPDKVFVKAETYNYVDNLIEYNIFGKCLHVNSFITVVALKALAAITGTEATNDEEIKAPNNLVEVLRNTAETTAIEECYRSDSSMSDEEQNDCYDTMLGAFEQNAKNLFTFHFNDPRNNSVQEVVVNLSQHSCIEIVSGGESRVLEIKTDHLGGRYLEDISMSSDLEFHFCQKVVI